MRFLFSQGGIRAGTAFAQLGVLFVILFGVSVILLVFDQQRIEEATTRLQKKTMPEIIRYQRLSRNLEQLRQEGERFFAATTPQARQQALFVVTLVSSHPSMLEHREAADLARQTERFLAEVLHHPPKGDAGMAASYEEWQRLAARLGLLVDDVSIQGTNLAAADLAMMSETMAGARLKLLVALGVVGTFLGVFLLLLRRHVIRPLQRIDEALSCLSVEQPVPAFEPSLMLEIQAVEAAIGELHESLVQHEEDRNALEKLANRDGLTGLTNRRHFLIVAEGELQRAQRYGRPLSIGMADLDFFKSLNDTYGHAAGDMVLRAFATMLQDTFRQSDLVCRYGGEEFAFLFPESGLPDARVLAERFRKRWSEYDVILPDGSLVRVTVSIGLADASSGTIDEALKAADDALYEAKRQGRNRTVISGSFTKTEEAGLPV